MSVCVFLPEMDETQIIYLKKKKTLLHSAVDGESYIGHSHTGKEKKKKKEKPEGEEK